MARRQNLGVIHKCYIIYLTVRFEVGQKQLCKSIHFPLGRCWTYRVDISPCAS